MVQFDAVDAYFHQFHDDYRICNQLIAYCVWYSDYPTSEEGSWFKRAHCEAVLDDNDNFAERRFSLDLGPHQPLFNFGPLHPPWHYCDDSKCQLISVLCLPPHQQLASELVDAHPRHLRQLYVRWLSSN